MESKIFECHFLHRYVQCKWICMSGVTAHCTTAELAAPRLGARLDCCVPVLRWQKSPSTGFERAYNGHGWGVMVSTRKRKESPPLYQKISKHGFVPLINVNSKTNYSPIKSKYTLLPAKFKFHSIRNCVRYKSHLIWVSVYRHYTVLAKFYELET